MNADSRQAPPSVVESGDGRSAEDDGPDPRLEDRLAETLPELVRRLRGSRWVARLGNESVEDLVQSVCREALEARAGYRHLGAAQFRAWLSTLARRKLSDRARHWNAIRRERGRSEESCEALLERASVAPPLEDDVERDDLKQRVSDALGSLSADQAAVLRLQLEESLATDEIARRLGKSAVAVRILRSRGLAALGRVLATARREPPMHGQR